MANKQTVEFIVDLSEVEKTSDTFKMLFSESIPLGKRIVRCRDCVYFEHADSEHDNNDWCVKHWHTAWSVNGFCAWAERKEVTK